MQLDPVSRLSYLKACGDFSIFLKTLGIPQYFSSNSSSPTLSEANTFIDSFSELLQTTNRKLK